MTKSSRKDKRRREQITSARKDKGEGSPRARRTWTYNPHQIVATFNGIPLAGFLAGPVVVDHPASDQELGFFRTSAKRGGTVSIELIMSNGQLVVNCPTFVEPWLWLNEILNGRKLEQLTRAELEELPVVLDRAMIYLDSFKRTAHECRRKFQHSKLAGQMRRVLDLLNMTETEVALWTGPLKEWYEARKAWAFDVRARGGVEHGD